MFKRLKLTNFRQHRNLEVLFTPGLNAIRGVNEAGKTTMLEGAAYVMFGARLALRESIDQVVTYGEKVSSLKAEMDMEVNGVTYCGKRSKSGAEVWLVGGTAPRVTGQDECVRFWEALLGVSGKVASDLMLANQTSIRGALEGGASAPVLLIEKLANFRVIDTIIGLVMDEVPNGQTKRIDERVKELEERVAEPIDESEVLALREAANAATTVLRGKEADRAAALAACNTHRPLADRAQHAKNELNDLRVKLGAVRAQLETAQNNIVEVPPAPDAAKIVELRKQVADVELFTRAKNVKALLDKLGAPEVEWDEGMDALLAAIAKADTASKAAQVEERKYRDEATRARAAIIKETSCAFCGKDLTDVPEVTTHNAALQNKYDSATGLAAEWREKIVAAEGEVADLRAVVADSNARDRIYRQCSEFISLDEAYVPARWTWTGPDLAAPVADVRDELQRLEQAQRRHDAAVGAKAQAEKALAALQQTEKAAAQAVTAAEENFGTLEPALVKAEELAAAYAGAETLFQQAQGDAQRAAGAHETASAVLGERKAARERLAAELTKARQELSDTVQGNGLLDKLRTARPQIADKLWNVVLASVSTYFSSIRGKASIVTREDNGFQVDGQPIDGLSGSTLDSLGLAIRVALVKTFLPNCGFMVLDEPQAACDDDRSINMIGLVASVGFDQVLLVTHSEVSDAFAQQVIQL